MNKIDNPILDKMFEEKEKEKAEQEEQEKKKKEETAQITLFKDGE